MPKESSFMGRIKIAYFGLLLILIGIMSLAFYTYQSFEKSGEQTFEDFRNVEYTLKIEAVADMEAIYVRNFLILGHADDLHKIIEAQKDIREWKTRLSQSIATSKGQKLLEEIERLEREEQRTINHSIALRKNNGNPNVLMRYFDDEVKPRHLALKRGLNLLIAHKEEVLQEQQDEYKMALSHLTQFSAWAGGLAFIAGLIFAWLGVNTSGRMKKVEVELRDAIQSRDEFLSIASHDLKTPITALLLQLQMLGVSVRKCVKQGSLESNPKDQPEPIPTKLMKAVDSCELQGKRLVKLIDDLFDLTRIRMGRLTLALSKVDLSAIAAEVIALNPLETLQNKSKITISTDGPVLGYWDSARLDQVVVNLISNAVKYGEGKPISIRVEADPERPLARLVVKDHGMGISPEMREKIFERFERAVAAGDKIKGLGLGLYIVRQIVETHGGSIRVESELGKGSTFVVELPMPSTEMLKAFSPSPVA